MPGNQEGLHRHAAEVGPKTLYEGVPAQPIEIDLPRRRRRGRAAVAGRTDSSPLVHPVTKIPVARGIEGNLARRTGACRRSRGGAVREQLVAVSCPIGRLDLIVGDVPALRRSNRERPSLPGWRRNRSRCPPCVARIVTTRRR